MPSLLQALTAFSTFFEAYAKAAASATEPYESELRELVKQKTNTDSLFKSFFNFGVRSI